MIPTWLRRHLDALGRLDPDGVSRRARAGTCRTCGAQVLRGLDADRAAIPVTADPAPLNSLGETMALINGRTTFDLEWGAGRCELNPRRAEHIAERPAARYTRMVVVAGHRCGQATMREGLLPVETVKAEVIGCPF